MIRPLGLHQLTAMDLTPVELVEEAAAAGYAHVSLFTNNPIVPLKGQEGKFVFPLVGAGNKRAVIESLGAHDLSVINAEFFLMRSEVALESYAPGLALARELGARHAVTHVFEPDHSRAVDILGRFCELVADYEIKVAIEFCQMTPGCHSIDQARWFVEQVGMPNLGFGICPMHLVRSGGTDDLVAENARHILFGQVNDAHGLHISAAYFDEVHDRQLPGDGDFPLARILGALPDGVPIEVKIPSDSRIRAGLSARDHIRKAYGRTRALIDQLPANPAG